MHVKEWLFRFKIFYARFYSVFTIKSFLECGNQDLVNAVQCAGRAGGWFYEWEVGDKTRQLGEE